MIKALTNWLEDRTGIGALTKEALFERVPGGARWRYVWGSTCLLYTSPSPRDATLSRMPSSA